ncbi:MAG: IS4 transposase [Halobacteriales archaeon]|jgi:IS4 transposase
MGGSRPPYDTVTLTRFAVPHAHHPEDKQTYFVTNMPVSETTAAALAESYRRRWGIETSYRVIGDFLAKTTSKSFAVRLYYFLFAVALYDIWVLTNVLLGVVFDDAQRDRPLIPSRVFARLLEKAARPTNPPP